MLNVAIVIPLYQELISSYEEIALQQCYSVLGNYTIIFVCPKKMEFGKFYKENNQSVFFVFLENDNFESIITYNKMLLSVWFYELFSSYNYILIYQLDCFVFKDELNYWAEKKYSYIGAPWFVGNSNDNSVDAFTGVGNGGFSLRNVNDCIKVLKSFKKVWSLKSHIQQDKLTNDKLHFIKSVKRYFCSDSFKTIRQNQMVNEDKIFCEAGKRFDFFKIPTPKEAIPFAFEMQPEKLFKLNNEQLPFGCHAWWKYNLNFYKKFIEHFGYNLENDLHKKTNH